MADNRAAVSDTQSDRDERGRFLRGHAPLPGGGRPVGSGFGRFRPLFGMMKQAVDSESLLAAAEAETSVVTLLRRRRAAAKRARRYRERRREGTRYAHIRLTSTIIAEFVEAGLLPSVQCTAGDLETAVLTMLDLIRNAGVNIGGDGTSYGPVVGGIRTPPPRRPKVGAAETGP